MKEVALEFTTVKAWEKMLADFAVLDWKETPGQVLDEVSTSLKPFGLEVVLGNADDDQYYFKIVKIAEAT